MKFRIDLKIFAFLVLLYFTKQIEIYGLIMIFAIIHELGHLAMGIILGFSPEKLEIIPLGLRISFKIDAKMYNYKIKNGNKYQLKKIIVALAGPLINLIIAFGTFKFSQSQEIVYANILIAIFNLLPIYPLDGGRILKGILYILFGNWKSKKYINIISTIFMGILTIALIIISYYFSNILMILIIIYLWALVIKERIKYKRKLNIYNLIKSIENNLN